MLQGCCQGRNLEADNEAEAHSSLAYSYGLLSLLSCITPDPCIGVAPPIVGWILPHLLSIKKMPPETFPQAK